MDCEMDLDFAMKGSNSNKKNEKQTKIQTDRQTKRTNKPRLKITRGRVRAGPIFQLGTLPTPIDRRLVFPMRWFSAEAAAASRKPALWENQTSIYL